MFLAFSTIILSFDADSILSKEINQKVQNTFRSFLSSKNIYKALQYLFLLIESAFADPVDLFISKTLFDKNVNECLHINISYIKLSDQYFLINIVLYHSRNKNYKSSSVYCTWK